MYRYIALVWNKYDNKLAGIAHSIARRIEEDLPSADSALDIDGLSVFQFAENPGRMQAYRLQGRLNGKGHGVVLGKLFQRQADGRTVQGPTAINARESAEIIQTRGRHLIDRYWGRYVAFLDDGATNSRYVLRDPMGEFPCYVTRHDGVDIYFSYMPDLARLGFLARTIDWTHVASFMAFGGLKTASTGYNEISELLPGHCREIQPFKTMTRCYWDPVRIAQSEVIEDPAEAAKALREVTRDCVQAWGASYDNVFLNLSGGLDSSIVLSCLKDTPSPLDIDCLNYYSAEKEGDERYFAQKAAKRAQVPLHEAKLLSSNIDLRRIPNMAWGVKPENYIFERAKNHFDPEWVRDKAPQACFYGSGGDNVFFQPHTHLGAIDYVSRHGVTAHMLGVAMEAARLERNSFWAVLVIALKNRFIKTREFPYAILVSENTATMNPEVLRGLNKADILLPCLRSSHKTPPGKLLHISIATNCPSYYEPIESMSDFLEPVMPLFSQPLVELCLRIPTWVLTTGGKDRGLARMAFAQDVPPEIIRRESKGGADNLFDTVLSENMDFIREFLLDGVLAEQGLLDRKRMEQILMRTDDSAVDSELVRVLFHICTEAWVRNAQK